MGQLDGKVAIVTGAGRGIGKATAICYAREGASVVVASRTQATLDGVVKQITDEGGKAIGITCDVGHKDQIFAMVDKAVNAFGPIDILVNNAQGFGTEANPQKSTVFVSVQDTDDVPFGKSQATVTVHAKGGILWTLPVAVEKVPRILVSPASLYLKRTEDGGHMELQALRYAAMVSKMTFSAAVEAHRKYLVDLESAGDPEEAILSFLGWEEPNKADFASDVRVLLVSAEFSKTTPSPGFTGT